MLNGPVYRTGRCYFHIDQEHLPQKMKTKGFWLPGKKVLRATRLRFDLEGIASNISVLNWGHGYILKRKSPYITFKKLLLRNVQNYKRPTTNLLNITLFWFCVLFCWLQNVPHIKNIFIIISIEQNIWPISNLVGHIITNSP